MSGGYRVKETVTNVSNLGEFEGIKSPKPGDTTSHPWDFTSTCNRDVADCGSKYADGGTLSRHGKVFSGSFPADFHANCRPSGQAPIHIQMQLTVGRVRGENQLVQVETFTGTYSLTFSCPNSQPSSGTVKVTGHLG